MHTTNTIIGRTLYHSYLANTLRGWIFFNCSNPRYRRHQASTNRIQSFDQVQYSTMGDIKHRAWVLVKSDMPMIHQNLTYTLFILVMSSMQLLIAMEVSLSHHTNYAKLNLQYVVGDLLNEHLPYIHSLTLSGSFFFVNFGTITKIKCIVSNIY